MSRKKDLETKNQKAKGLRDYREDRRIGGRKCPLISALPYSQRSSEEVEARKGLVAPGSLRLRQRQERKVALRRVQECGCVW
jgi:hypothetical protein